MEQLKLQVILFLGELGGQVNHYSTQISPQQLAELATSWDPNPHLRFDLPFPDLKATVYLGKSMLGSRKVKRWYVVL